MNDPIGSKKPSRRTSAKPIPANAFENRQLSLFQGFLANTGDERDALSNAIDLWDRSPRYSIPRMIW